MNSQTVCAGIKGYKGMTPVMVMTDKKGKIQKVALLTHCETLSYGGYLKIPVSSANGMLKA